MLYFLLFFIALTPLGWMCYSKQKKVQFLQKELKNCKKEVENFSLKAQEQSFKSPDNEAQKKMELLSIVATQTENAIMIMDPDGNIEWLNDGFTRMYGYTYEEFTAMRGSNIRQTSFSGIIDERLRKCKTSGKPVFYDAPNSTHDGREIWTHTILTPIFNEKDELIYLATIDTDIHRRKTAADVLLKELAALRVRLDHLSSHQKTVTNVISELISNQEKSGREVDATHEIVHFINNMSDRIKIMGLNASIEAASIGNNGHSNGNGNNTGAGFRVLAGEIIKMSEETKVHSGEIGDAVGRLSSSFERVADSKADVTRATKGFHRTIKELEDSLFRVEEVAETLNE